MQSAAHPDDEHNALFALYTHGMGLRSIDLQTNRGEGGQNEIGPELFRDIGVLRTSELLAAHRIDGAEQYFTRGHRLRLFVQPAGSDRQVGTRRDHRRLRPPDPHLPARRLPDDEHPGGGGDRAHEATTILATEAYKAAGDPTEVSRSDQGRPPALEAEEVLLHRRARRDRRPRWPGWAWRTRRSRRRRLRSRLRRTAGCGGCATSGGTLARINTGAYDELLGRTYAEIGSDAHSNHKCQGTGGLPAIPGVQRAAAAVAGRAAPPTR